MDTAIARVIIDDILKTLRMDIYVHGLIYISVESMETKSQTEVLLVAPTRSIEYKSSRGAERVVRFIYLHAGRLAGSKNRKYGC